MKKRELKTPSCFFMGAPSCRPRMGGLGSRTAKDIERVKPVAPLSAVPNSRNPKT